MYRGGMTRPLRRLNEDASSYVSLLYKPFVTWPVGVSFGPRDSLSVWRIG